MQSALPLSLMNWSFDSLTEGSIRWAKIGILDCLGCIAAGSRTVPAKLVRDMVEEAGSAPRASILGTPLRASPSLAALANGVAGHALDYDDMNFTMIAHPSVFLVPAILALAEIRGSSGREVISAYVYGFEVAGHFAAAMNPAHYERGWHATSSLGVLGAAAAAARIIGLDQPATLSAIGIAASGAAGLRRNFGSMTKSLHAGQAAERGVLAADLAARGFTARHDFFDGPDGFIALYGGSALMERDADDQFEIERNGIGIKPHACCGAGISVIDAALDLVRQHDFSPGDIVSVECDVSPLARSIMPYGRARDGLEAKYCINYCVAVALLDGKGGLPQFEDTRVNSADVQAMAERVRVEPRPELIGKDGRFDVFLKVRLKDNRLLASETSIPRGHPTRPLQPAELEEKFRECALPVIGEKQTANVIMMIRELEEIDDVGLLAAALCENGTAHEACGHLISDN